jgi:hypothetical protein
MKRTTIMFPDRLMSRAEKLARQEGVSLGQLIRVTMEERVAISNGHKRDPLFADDCTYEDDLPGDVSANLDKYLGAMRAEEVRRWGKK